MLLIRTLKIHVDNHSKIPIPNPQKGIDVFLFFYNVCGSYLFFESLVLVFHYDYQSISSRL